MNPYTRIICEKHKVQLLFGNTKKVIQQLKRAGLNSGASADLSLFGTTYLYENNAE